MDSKKEYLKNSKVLWYGVSTVLIAALIYFADVQEFIRALRSVDPVYMTLGFISGISVFLVWGYVWHSFFIKLEIRTTLYKSYKMFMAGHFMNSITPLGQLGGEPFMAYVVSKNTDSSYEKSLSGVMSSDIINAIPVITYTAAGIIYLLLFRTLSGFVEQVIYFGLGTALIIALMIYLLWFDKKKMEAGIFGMLNFIERRLEIGDEYFEPLKSKIRSLKKSFEKIGDDPRHLVKVALISHIYFITQFICLYFILKGLEVDPGFVGIYFTVILAGLAIFAPTPGGTGAYETVFTGFLLFFYPAMDPSTAVATAILFRLTTYWPGILIGYFCILNLRKTREAAEEARS
jgi:uncharacterized protein (TIRG00374 family)